METLTKHQIIDETVEYYSNNPRAVEGHSCVYKTPDGRMCGHSRCLTNEARNKISNNSSSATNLIKIFGDDIHKEKYRGHEPEFWKHIQRLHDIPRHWDGNRLTDEGQEYVYKLKQYYKD